MRSGDIGSALRFMGEKLSYMTPGRASDLFYLIYLKLIISETIVIILRVVPRTRQNVQGIDMAVDTH